MEPPDTSPGGLLLYPYVKGKSQGQSLVPGVGWDTPHQGVAVPKTTVRVAELPLAQLCGVGAAGVESFVP